MKQCDIEIGDTVYIKKSNKWFCDPETPRVVTHIEHRKHKHHRIFVSGETRAFNAGELTAIPCSVMGCDNCIYHGGTNDTYC